MKTISIITPIYKGKKYLGELWEMISECACRAKSEATVQWIISNDYPEERLFFNENKSDVDVVVLNTDINRGIQGARVRGLEVATGDYILFLDQDDWISPDWISSQIACIGDADACVCSATRDGMKFYDTAVRPALDVCITKEYNLETNWGFLPGQVLIKKESIPAIWKKRWLKWNCCDDYLLWIVMYASGCIFVANEESLYDHRTTGSNQGRNTFAWYKSTQEMLEYLKNVKVMQAEEYKVFNEARQQKIDENFMDITWGNLKVRILDCILSIYEGKTELPKDLRNLYEKRAGIAIYGAGIGKHVAELFIKEGANVICFIDRNKDAISTDIPVVDKDEIPTSVELVINTLIRDRNEVAGYLNEKYPSIEVVHINDLLF